MRSLPFLFLVLLIPLIGEAKFPADCESFQKAVSKGTEGEKLKKFFSVQWDYYMKDRPEYATFSGVKGYDDRWTDLSNEARKARRSSVQCQKQALLKIKRQNLSAFDKVSYDLNLRGINESLESQKFDGDYLAIDQMNGVHSDISDVLGAMPKNSIQDYDNMLARLKGAPRLIEQTQALLAEGLKRKVTPPQLILQKIPFQFDSLLTAKVEDSVFYKTVTDFKPSIPAAQQERIRTAAKELIQKEVEPALKQLRDFLVKEYIPQARQSFSWSDLPNGKEWYHFLIRSHTSTQKSALELHNLGLSEVARIQSEMEKIKTQVRFSRDLKAFNKFLLTDKQFYFENPKDLIITYRDIAKRIDPELPRLFKTLPRLPYGVREIPAHKAPAAPTAYYQSGNLESGRPGYFEANTYDLTARPKWAMEALTIHEAVPGHHLQIALAEEISDMPEFRKRGGPTAFVEGWALYAESLGEEMGFYKDPYAKYGQLSYELWRAVRLVVDTGMHELGWSREKALKYYMDQLPKAPSESEAEIDRYIVMAGQALAYKVGQLKFLELRTKAERILGNHFDIREFHNEVLRHGAVPLDILETAFETWIKSKKKFTLGH